MPLAIFHRANTAELCHQAIREGAPMVEFDVRPTGDGHFVTFHDRKVRGRLVSRMSLEELRQQAEEPAPLLEEILNACAGKVRINVELKEPVGVEEVLRQVFCHFPPSEVLVSSFYGKALWQAKQFCPQVATSLLVGRHRPYSWWSRYIPALFPFRQAKDCGADYLSPHYYFRWMGIFPLARRAKMKLFFWTVNQQKMWDFLWKKEEVCGIITDRLEWMKYESKSLVSCESGHPY